MALLFVSIPCRNFFVSTPTLLLLASLPPRVLSDLTNPATTAVPVPAPPPRPLMALGAVYTNAPPRCPPRHATRYPDGPFGADNHRSQRSICCQVRPCTACTCLAPTPRVWWWPLHLYPSTAGSRGELHQAGVGEHALSSKQLAHSLSLHSCRRGAPGPFRLQVRQCGRLHTGATSPPVPSFFKGAHGVVSEGYLAGSRLRAPA